MALTKVIGSGVQGIANASDATFLTATSAEGVTLAGTLAVTGVHTVGTNAVATSDAGAATTSIVQGLAKVWILFPGDAASISDSFNVTSLTDTATGNASVVIANNMNNTLYSYVNGNQFTTASGGNAFFANAGAEATTGYDVTHYQNGGLADSVKASSAIHGDLA